MMKKKQTIYYGISLNLASNITQGIKDFVTSFGRNPLVIRIPEWRREELRKDFEGLLKPMTATEKTIYGTEDRFQGIAVKYHNLDFIELQ